MNKSILQRLIFIIFATSALLNPFLTGHLPWFKFIVQAGAVLYLSLGWYFTMIREGGYWLGNELVGYIYATVFTASLLSAWQMPMAELSEYYGIFLALALMIYMLIKRKTVRRDMLIQSIVLFLVSPIPMWV
jgi:hypothetical protein